MRDSLAGSFSPQANESLRTSASHLRTARRCRGVPPGCGGPPEQACPWPIAFIFRGVKPLLR